MMTWRTFLSVVTVFALCSTSQAQSYRNQDAAVGGLAGAVIGGIIGHQNDETPEGALIGGAVGAIAGGLLGNAKDQGVAQHRYYHQQVRRQAWQQHQQQQAIGRAVTLNDVVNMSKNGLGDTVIMNQIRTNGVVGQIGTHEIIALHNSGVSEHVITAMQQAPQAGVPETVVVHESVPVRRPTQVIVHKEYVVPAPRVRYATRPAFPTYPSRQRFHRYW